MRWNDDSDDLVEETHTRRKIEKEKENAREERERERLSKLAVYEIYT